mmetsp:Transcript_4329/g.10031  ORF Transcript_4329/g.10031 Transcript_4329/m.10031 type:complete len:543 (+) Transcript_4329:354-1982(+)
MAQGLRHHWPTPPIPLLFGQRRIRFVALWVALCNDLRPPAVVVLPAGLVLNFRNAADLEGVGDLCPVAPRSPVACPALLVRGCHQGLEKAQSCSTRHRRFPEELCSAQQVFQIPTWGHVSLLLEDLQGSHELLAEVGVRLQVRHGFGGDHCCLELRRVSVLNGLLEGIKCLLLIGVHAVRGNLHARVLAVRHKPLRQHGLFLLVTRLNRLEQSLIEGAPKDLFEEAHAIDLFDRDGPQQNPIVALLHDLGHQRFRDLLPVHAGEVLRVLHKLHHRFEGLRGRQRRSQPLLEPLSDWLGEIAQFHVVGRHQDRLHGLYVHVAAEGFLEPLLKQCCELGPEVALEDLVFAVFIQERARKHERMPSLLLQALAAELHHALADLQEMLAIEGLASEDQWPQLVPGFLPWQQAFAVGSDFEGLMDGFAHALDTHVSAACRDPKGRGVLLAQNCFDLLHHLVRFHEDAELHERLHSRPKGLDAILLQARQLRKLALLCIHPCQLPRDLLELPTHVPHNAKDTVEERGAVFLGLRGQHRSLDGTTCPFA